MHKILFILMLTVPGLGFPAKPADLGQITILSTMLANFSGEGEWGFSALVEAGDEKILFDTGFKQDTVSNNAAALGISLADVEKVVLTHFHTDHTGGLLSLRRKYRSINADAFSTVYVARGFFEQRYDAQGNPIYALAGDLNPDNFIHAAAFRSAAETLGITFQVLEKPTEIAPGFFLTGPVARVHDERNVSPGAFLQHEGARVADFIPESQALGVMTEHGWLLLSGCGHAGIVNAATALRAISAEPVFMGIGGFHLFRANAETLTWTANQLQSLGLQKLVGAHCTGVAATYHLAEQLNLPHSDVSIGAVGTQISPTFEIIRSSVE